MAPVTMTRGALRCRRKFLRMFPSGFGDETYIDWERSYKEDAHREWQRVLGGTTFRELIERRRYREVADAAVKIESRTNLLFSFEKMAIRDGIKTSRGAKTFAIGLFEFLHGPGGLAERFETWCDAVDDLPRRQTRVLTWPVVTVFGFIAQPKRHLFLKPTVTKVAAEHYDYDFAYRSRPNWETYRSLIGFAEAIERDQADLRPRDRIDVQSFIWVQGSDEYEE